MNQENQQGIKSRHKKWRLPLKVPVKLFVCVVNQSVTHTSTTSTVLYKAGDAGLSDGGLLPLHGGRCLHMWETHRCDVKSVLRSGMACGLLVTLRCDINILTK